MTGGRLCPLIVLRFTRSTYDPLVGAVTLSA
jgi:hypothetical protein